MAQNYNDQVYSQSLVADTGFTRMQNNFAAVKSCFSGSSPPPDQVAGMLWMRTGGTGNGLRVRNAGNTAWHKVLTGTANLKLWMYRNDSDEGWVIDATVTDRVIAIKGGAQAYNVAGGTLAGTWTQPDHTLTEAELPAHTHTVSGGAPQAYCTQYAAGSSAAGLSYASGMDMSASWLSGLIGGHAHSVSSTGSGSAHNHGTTHRPAAAVGTLQYPDLA